MKIKDIIDTLEKQGEWVNRTNTRDHILFGDDDVDVDAICICWVATFDVIHQAIKKGCHLIITHENPFYLSSTLLPSAILKAQKEKEQLLSQHHITVYRCHDLWDLYSQYGVRDMWAKTLQFPFQPLHQHSFLGICSPINMTTEALAKHIIQCIEPDYQYGIQVIGDQSKVIHRLGIGTGACTDVFEMCEHNVDACLVSDDGINNWVGVQWAMDHNIPLIVINHMTCEAPGMKGLQHYLQQQFPHITCHYIPNTYGIHHIEK